MRKRVLKNILIKNTSHHNQRRLCSISIMTMKKKKGKNRDKTRMKMIQMKVDMEDCLNPSLQHPNIIHSRKNYKIYFLTLKPFYFADPFSRVKQKLVRQYSPDIKAMHPKVRYRGKLIFFSRHGESEYNVENKVGGDSPLSDRGALYAKALGRYFNNLGKSCKKYFILISLFNIYIIYNITTFPFRNRYEVPQSLDKSIT